MHKISDETIEQLKKGKKEAFEIVFKMYYTKLHSYARCYVRDDDVASDIVQDVYTTLWEKRDQIEMLGFINVYLFRSVQNKCHNHLEHQKIRIKHINYVKGREHAESIHYLDSLGFETGSIFESELTDIIKSTIDELPTKCKEVFTLSRFEGMKNREISEELEISIKAVEKHISLALLRLRKALKDYLPFILLNANSFLQYFFSINSDSMVG